MGWKQGLMIAGMFALSLAGVWLLLQREEPIVVQEITPSTQEMQKRIAGTEVHSASEGAENVEASMAEAVVADPTGPGRIEVWVVLDAGIDIGDTPVRLCGWEASDINRRGPVRFWTQPLDDRQRAVFEDLPFGQYVAAVETEEALGVSTGIAAIRARESEMTLSVRVGRSGHIAGVIINQAGAPISGAEIHHRIASEFYRRHSEVTAARSDEWGEFSIAVPATRSTQALRARAEGFAPLDTEPLAVGTEDAVLQMGAGGAASGIVVMDQSGEPVPGAALQVMTEHQESEQHFVSDAEGRFHLTMLSPGEKQILSDDPSLSVKWHRVRFPVEAGEETQDLEVRLLASGAVSGRAYCVETDDGIPGVPVTLDGGAFSATTDAEGRYSIRNVPEGVHRVEYESLPGYKLVVDVKDVRRNSYRSAVVFAGETAEGVDLVFSKVSLSGIQVKGRVVDHRGAPLADARVKTRAAATETVSGSDGRFALCIAVDEWGDELTAELPGFVMKPLFVKSNQARDGQTVELVMYPACSISGIAVDPFGNPLGGVAFMLREFKDGEPQGFDLDRISSVLRNGLVFSNAGGEFSLENLLPGTYSPSSAEDIGGSGRLKMAPVEQSILLHPGQHVANARLVFQEGVEREREVLGQVAGRVTDDTGNPIPGAEVSSKNAASAVLTDSQGYYVLDILAPQMGHASQGIAVSAKHKDFKRTSSGLVQIGDMEVNLTLKPLEPETFMTVTGRVFDATTRAPVTAFDLALLSPRPDDFSGYQLIRNSNGSFRYENLRQTSYVWAQVSADGYSPARIDIRDVPPTETMVHLDIPLRRRVPAEGIVRDTAGAPVSGAEVFVVDGISSATLPDAQTDREGRFRLIGAGEGMQEITVRAPGYTGFRREVPVPQGGGGLIQITLWRGGAYTIRVSLDGTPASNARLQFEVRADSGEVRSYSGSTTRSGERAYQNLDPGHYIVTAEVETPEGGIVSETVAFRVEPGKLTEVEIALRSENSVSAQ